MALVAGWAVCRRALAPVTRMAEAACAMGGAHLDGRLPAAGSGDELADLSVAFNGLLDRLQESFDRQRQFTGDASHQLRTPLTALLGQIEVALRRERPSEEYRRVLSSVQRQALSLRRIVETLLFLARADAEAQLPKLERVDLAEWLSEHLRSWADHPRVGDLRPQWAPGNPVWAKVQPPLLGELVNNLIDNACKYSRPGTPITLRLGHEEGMVFLAVEDEGCGVGLEDQQHLFELFYRSAQALRLGVSVPVWGLRSPPSSRKPLAAPLA